MKRLITTAILVLFATSICGAQESNSDFDISQIYPIENSHSYVGFSVKYMGYAMVKGRFQKFNGSVRYDEDDLEKTSVSISIPANSIDTDHDWRDKDLRSDQWFDAEKYPFITFKSTKVEKAKIGFQVIGNLTIKEITKEVTIKMDKPSGVLKDGRGDSQIIFTGTTSIDRTEFGVEGARWSKVKEGIMGVDNKILIELSILAKRINAGNFKNWVKNENSPQGKIYKVISEQGVQEGLKTFDQLKDEPDSRVTANSLNVVGYMLLKENRTKEAIQVFKKNIDAFPDDPNVYDSYAEAIATDGNLPEASKYYKLALEKNPENVNALEILRHLD
ncbi:YceI family protein [Fulvivirgaceae bacterium BMA10]|uniref:YceI family protein n=1 Tax=Splendidivirga corallicola TaxID=3051826 RepID=A0ABT8KR21_9BACT|nr:YceI family protein [Fulvivirgaceae bacterium BMA10]